MDKHIPNRLRDALKPCAITSAEGAELKVVDCVENTAAATFYAELFDEQLKTERPGEWRRVKREAGVISEEKSDERPVDSEWVQIVDFLTGELPENALVIELGGGVYQRRCGFMNRYFENYFPLDISRSSIAGYAKRYGRWGIASDATCMPLKDASVDCIFSRTFMEHVPDPEKALVEISRVLKPNGIVLHDDAWFCRWWQRHGVVGLKRLSEMNWSERLIWLASQFTEMKVVRLQKIIIPRLIREIFISRQYPLGLPFGRLQPNYNLHLGCDEDAAASIDPLNVIRFYESRGFELVKPMSFKQRLLLRNTPVILRRKDYANG